MEFDPNTKPTRQNFAELPPLCLDGAWGTEMQKRGAKAGEMCDHWNLDHPDRVLDVAKAYVEADAQVILTNTFCSNRIMMEKHGLADRAAEIARAGAALSRKAAEGRAYVFGSIGPCGKMVMMGEVDPEVVKQSAAEQAAALAEGGVDAIIIETQSDLTEAEAALRGALEAVALPVGISFTFDSGPNGDRTMMGVSVPQAHELAVRLGASFVGSNCGAGIETFPNLARLYSACSPALPIWVKGNAGQPEIDAEGKAVYNAPEDLYARLAGDLLAAGARFIGGCCGSHPGQIRQLAKSVRSLAGSR